LAFSTNCTDCTALPGTPNALLTVHTGIIDVELLGLNVEICPICIRVFTSNGITDLSQLTDLQKAQLQQIINAIKNLLNSVVPTIGL
jgi:hypothetical protein